MKKIMTNDMVAHCWANQTQEEGRNSTGSLYFKGNTIYSYGAHFPIASIHTNQEGQSLTLVNSSHYSATTSQHQAQVRQAMHGAHVSVPYPMIQFETEFNHKRNLAYLEGEYLGCCKEALTSIKHTAGLAASRVKWSARHEQYRTFFDLTVEAPAITKKWLTDTFPKRFPTVNSDEHAVALWTEAMEARVKHQEEKAKTERIRFRERMAKQEARAAEEAKQAIANWLSPGDTGCRSMDLYGLPIYLRVKPSDPTMVQTSRGAEVPLDHAQLLWERVKKVMSTGTEYHRNGHTLHAGVFAVDSITVDGTLTAGCHMILYPQLLDFAKRMGWV